MEHRLKIGKSYNIKGKSAQARLDQMYQGKKAEIEQLEAIVSPCFEQFVVAVDQRRLCGAGDGLVK